VLQCYLPDVPDFDILVAPLVEQLNASNFLPSSNSCSFGGVCAKVLTSTTSLGRIWKEPDWTSSISPSLMVAEYDPLGQATAALVCEDRGRRVCEYCVVLVKLCASADLASVRGNFSLTGICAWHRCLRLGNNRANMPAAFLPSDFSCVSRHSLCAVT
jgi:hypothetical protein